MARARLRVRWVECECCGEMNKPWHVCDDCGRCPDCCECDEQEELFDADELGLDPEDDEQRRYPGA